MVDKVVGEELSEPTLEAKLDVMLEVKLDANGLTTEKTLFCVWRWKRKRKKRTRCDVSIPVLPVKSQ